MSRFALVLTLLVSTPAMAGNENAVAVLDIQGTGISPELLPTLTEVLTVEIAELGLYKVIAGRDIQSMLGFEKQKDVLGCTDAACLAEIGGALGVDRIVASHIGMVGSTYVVNIKLINIRMADTESRVYETVRGEVDALIATMKKSVQKLLGVGSKAAIALGKQQPAPAVARAEPAATPAPAPQPAASAPAGETKVAAADQPVAQVERKGEGSSIGVAPFIFWGVGVGLAAVGGVFGAGAKKAESHANDSSYVGGQKEVDVARSKASAATVAFALSGASVAGGFLWWWLVSPDTKPGTTALAPMVGDGSLGLAYSSSF